MLPSPLARLNSDFPPSRQIWKQVSRPSYHPISKLFRRRRRRFGSRPPFIWISLAAGILLLLLTTWLYARAGVAILWMTPLLLTCHSTACGIFWVRGIVSLMSRQGLERLLDQVGVTPPGPVFVYLTICKVVLHADDALAWMTLARRLLAGAALLGLLLPILLIWSQVDDARFGQLALILAQLALLSLVIVLEHRQSAVLGCLLPMLLRWRFRAPIDATSAVIGAYVMLQLLSGLLALSLPIVINFALPTMDEALGLPAALGGFLILRELLILALWRALLHQENDERSSALAGPGLRGRGWKRPSRP